MPGNDGGGFILTCVLGVVGAVVGGWLATMFGFGGDISGFDMHSFWSLSWEPLSCWAYSDYCDEHKMTERLSAEGRFCRYIDLLI